MFNLLASVGEMERENNKERTSAGLAAVRAKGRVGGGRKLAMTLDKLDTAQKLLQAGDKPAKAARVVGVGLSTFYRHFPATDREPA
jgi:DNA invertase Pin-like site-specific DNA recombinase